MIPLTLAQIADAVDGRVVGASVDDLVTSVVVDSREVVAGALFVAIAGEHVDGHEFAAQAVADGAVAVLSGRELAQPCIVVDDPVLALGRLARWVRHTKLTCDVIAITGSSGKTSTKDLTAQVLATIGSTVSAHGSFNTEVGVPLTILQADADTEYLVLEMGMRGEGHIAYLCEIAAPRIAVLVNVGSAHLGLLGSREAVARAKGEIFQALPDDGVAIVLGDDPLALAQTERSRARTVTFGESVHCDVRATDIRLDDQARASFTLTFGGSSESVHLQLHGEHAVRNALAAAAVAFALDVHEPHVVAIENVAMALRAASNVSPWRMEVHHTAAGVTVINDAYNANPESMRVALKTLVAMAAGRRSWAVLGEMRELGADSVTEHDALGRLAVRLDVSRLICVGNRVMHLGAATEGSWENESMYVDTPDEAIDILRRELVAGDVVLVKASRSIGLERVAHALIEGGDA